MTAPKPVPGHLLEYRKVLVAADQKGQEEFDKAVLALSGGGLGVSIVFLKDIVGTSAIELPLLLMGAWVSWGLSTLLVLMSYHLANLTVRAGIRQIDRGDAYTGPFGGGYATWTNSLNIVGALLFFVGVLLITTFACVNLYAKGLPNGNSIAATAPAASASSRAVNAAASSASSR